MEAAQADRQSDASYEANTRSSVEPFGGLQAIPRIATTLCYACGVSLDAASAKTHDDKPYCARCNAKLRR